MRATPMSPRGASSLRRIPRPWVPLLLAALVAAVVYWPDGLRPHRPHHLTQTEQVHLAAPTGPRTQTADVCMVEVIDQSSSMAGSDPDGLRATSVGAVADWLGRYGRRGDRLGVVWFADSTSVFPIAAPKANPKALAQAAVDPGDTLGGSTNMADALTEAGTQLARCPATSARSLVMISDGVVDDADAIGDQIRQLPSGTSVHLVAMDVDGSYTSSARPLWEDPALGLASIQRVEEVDAAGVTDPIAFVLSLETGQAVQQGQ